MVMPLAIVGTAWAYFLFLPWPHLLRWRDPDRTAFMEYRVRAAEARGQSLDIHHEWVPLDRISNHLRRAVLVAEDARFYDHRGIDWDALREELRYEGGPEFSWTDPDDLRAAWTAVNYYRANRDRVRGRSTITQQLAKNLYFTSDRSMRRKLEELIVAGRIERALDKDRILELYLNVAEWGPGIFGAGAAARHYFGRSATDLSREQAAALAATLPHPLTSNPAHRPGRMQWRQRLILQRMGAAGPVETVPLAPFDEADEEEQSSEGPPLLGEPADSAEESAVEQTEPPRAPVEPRGGREPSDEEEPRGGREPSDEEEPLDERDSPPAEPYASGGDRPLQGSGVTARSIAISSA